MSKLQFLKNFSIVLFNSRGWINHSSPTENISEPGFSLNSAEEEQQNNSVGMLYLYKTRSCSSCGKII